MKHTAPDSTAPLGAFLVRSLPRGGLERVLLSHATVARRVGYRTEVLCLEQPGELAPAFEAAGIPVESLGLPDSAIGSAWLGLPRLRAWLTEKTPAWLQVHMRRAATLGRLAARMQGVPTILALHNQTPPPPPWLAPLEGWLDQQGHYLAVSRAARDHSCRVLKISRQQVYVVPNWLPPQARRKLFLRGAPRRIGFLGKLEPKKGPRHFLKMAKHLDQRQPGLDLSMAGTGPDVAALAPLAAEAGVAMLGAVEDGPGYLASLDLACFPSQREGFGLAVGEALAVGTLVLLSDIDPFREVYGTLPSECFLPRNATAQVWAGRARLLLTEPRLRRQIKQAVPGILARWSRDRHDDRAREFYASLLDGSGTVSSSTRSALDRAVS